MKTAILLAILLTSATNAAVGPAPAVRGERLARQHAVAHALRVALHARLSELRH